LYEATVNCALAAPPGRTIATVNDLLLVLIVILVIVLIVRGPRTLPQLGRMFGRGVREAREEIGKVRRDDEPDEGTRAP